MKNPLFVNKKVWKAFSSQELEEYKQKVYSMIFTKVMDFPTMTWMKYKCQE